MTVGSTYPRSRRSCQSPWLLGDRLDRTWQRNPNYRHGRWSRYRLRLEARLEAARARNHGAGPLPPYAPGAGAWPGLGRYLPRRAWSAARAWLRMARLRAAWRRLWEIGPRTGPPPVLSVLGVLFQGLTRAP